MSEDSFAFEADVHDRAMTSKETRTEIVAGITINITTPEATLKPSSLATLRPAKPQGGTCHLTDGAKVPIKVTLHPSSSLSNFGLPLDPHTLPLPIAMPALKEIHD